MRYLAALFLSLLLLWWPSMASATRDLASGNYMDGGTLALDLTTPPPWFSGTWAGKPSGAGYDVGFADYYVSGGDPPSASGAARGLGLMLGL